MAVDNLIYQDLDWWDPRGPVAGLHAMNPARAGYFAAVLRRAGLGAGPLLEVGCGGGLLSEALAAEGVRVVGVDQALGACRAARRHAAPGLAVAYLAGDGLRLPFADRSFPAVLGADYLEHVPGLSSAVAELGRVLRPGGVLLYETINRTWLSALIHIGLLQRWRRIVPADTHAWRSFVTPGELDRALLAAGLEPVDRRGLAPEQPLRFVLALLRHRPGRDRMGRFRVGGSSLGSYLGWARRR